MKLLIKNNAHRICITFPHAVSALSPLFTQLLAHFGLQLENH